MKESLTKKIKIGFAVSIAALLVLIILSLYNLDLLVRRTEWVNHTNEVLLKLNDVVSGLKDAETGQRGYLLTSNPEFLEPYIGSYHRVFQSFNEVKTLTIDNPKQQVRLDTLRILINARFNHINKTIELEKVGKSDSAQRMVKEGAGKKIMDDVRRVVNIMSQEEIALRKERNEAVRASSFFTPVLILVFSLLALLTAVVSYFLINRDNKKRIRAENDLLEAKKELEESYEELTVREEQLRALNVELEDRVEERTKEVSQGIQKLRESEMRSRLLIEAVTDYAIFMLDEHGKIVSWNYGAERLNGYKRDEIIGKHFSVFFTPDHVNAGIPDKELISASETGRFLNEGWRVRKDGAVFWASISTNAIRNDQGKLVGFVKIIRDLSERKKAEDSLRKVNNDLDTFVYIASHDLKAPIANLEGLLNTVHEELAEHCSGEVRALFDMMETSIHKLNTTITELSDVHYVQKDFNKDIQEILMDELLAEVKTNHADIIKSSNAAIYTNFQVPSIKYSRRNLLLILDNLITNAILYKSLDRDPEILITTYEEKEWFTLSVKDNGLGIDPKKGSKIFGMFQRLHSHVEGSGMGLYLVKRIIENAGGKIEFESEVGKGTTFIVYFKKSQ